MSDCTRWSFQRKIDWFRSQFAQHASLPFSDVLPAQVVTSALETLGMHCYNSLYNPVTVLWLFLSQVIHPNPTLAATVESFLAWRLGQGMSPCSTDTGGYARARQRLPEALLAMLVRHTGSATDRAALTPWRWLGRTVKLFDGSTVSMPDTPENQAAYPQSRTQAAGVGFPLARIGVLFSLSVGTVLNLGIRRWAGKFQSELAMLRDMIAELDSGRRFAHRSLSLLLHGNRFAAAARRRFRGTNARETARRFSLRPAARPLRSCGPMEQARATRMDVSRTIRRDPRDPFDPRVSLPDRPPWLPRENDRGGHDAVERQAYSMANIADLYRLRWDAEINLRSLKTMMNMDVLRCQSPEMVRKEIWAHLLAYNLIRTVIAQAAAKHDKHPRQISFTRAMRTLEAFRSPLAHTPSRELAALYEHMLQAIASHEIANRPNRLEPRQRKRRPKPYDLMTKPRSQARRQEAKTR